MADLGLGPVSIAVHADRGADEDIARAYRAMLCLQIWIWLHADSAPAVLIEQIRVGAVAAVIGPEVGIEADLSGAQFGFEQFADDQVLALHAVAHVHQRDIVRGYSKMRIEHTRPAEQFRLIAFGHETGTLC